MAEPPTSPSVDPNAGEGGLGYPAGTWDAEPGDMFALDADLTVYWPRVRPCWEER